MKKGRPRTIDLDTLSSARGQVSLSRIRSSHHLRSVSEEERVSYGWVEWNWV